MAPRVTFPARHPIHSRGIRNATLPDFWEVDQEGLLARYNRVDGPYVALHFLPAYEERRNLYGELELGYAFGGEYWRYQVGVEVLPFYWMNRGRRGGIPSGLVAVGAEAHSLTDTDDEWVISEEENTLTSLFVRRDFLDYYRRSGWSAYVTHDMGGWLRAARAWTSRISRSARAGPWISRISASTSPGGSMVREADGMYLFVSAGRFE